MSDRVPAIMDLSLLLMPRIPRELRAIVDSETEPSLRFFIPSGFRAVIDSIDFPELELISEVYGVPEDQGRSLDTLRTAIGSQSGLQAFSITSGDRETYSANLEAAVREALPKRLQLGLSEPVLRALVHGYVEVLCAIERGIETDHRIKERAVVVLRSTGARIKGVFLRVARGTNRSVLFVNQNVARPIRNALARYTVAKHQYVKYLEEHAEEILGEHLAKIAFVVVFTGPAAPTAAAGKAVEGAVEEAVLFVIDGRKHVSDLRPV